MNKIFYLILGSSLIFVLSCKKNQLGGKSTVKGVVVHHAKHIPDAVLYIKFNAKEFPGRDSSVYDAKIQADDHGAFTFKCYKGDYYIFATGLDYQQVTLYVNGGTPVHIRNKETLEIEVPVSDKH